MYDKCESCGKWIEDAEDCRLVSNNNQSIITYCKECYDKRQKNRL
jgi:hypothetical protein